MKSVSEEVGYTPPSNSVMEGLQQGSLGGTLSMETSSTESADNPATSQSASALGTLQINHPPETIPQARPYRNGARIQSIAAPESLSCNNTSTSETTHPVKTSANSAKDMQDFINGRFEALKIDQIEELARVMYGATNNIQLFVNQSLKHLKSHHINEPKTIINVVTKDFASKVQKDLILDLMKNLKEGAAKASKAKKRLKWGFLVPTLEVVGPLNRFAQSSEAGFLGLVTMIAQSIMISTMPRWLTEEPRKMVGRGVYASML